MSESPFVKRADVDTSAGSSTSTLRERWNAAPDDPDLEEHLGYELVEWDCIETGYDDKVLFLPSDEEHLREEEFIVADAAAVVTLG